MLLMLPLRYPGGKGQAHGKILPLIPQNAKTVAAPFFGGGAVELNLAFRRGVRIFGYDAFPQLVNFWRHALRDPAKLADAAERDYYPLEKERFLEMQQALAHPGGDPFERAVQFYAVNRSSFSGATLSGGMAPGHDHHTLKTIANLRNFPLRSDRVAVAEADFAESISRHAADFLFLDPPYMLGVGDRLYGNKGDRHRDFDHAKLASLLLERDRWLMTYNDCEWVRNTYADCEFRTPQWHYGMRKDGKSSEIIIAPPGTITETPSGLFART